MYKYCLHVIYMHCSKQQIEDGISGDRKYFHFFKYLPISGCNIKSTELSNTIRIKGLNRRLKAKIIKQKYTKVPSK